VKNITAILFVLCSLVAMAGNTLKVQVLDENNEPLTGVKLVAVEDHDVLFTDFEGTSELTDIRNTKVFKVEYVGYESGYIKVSPNSKKEITIVLRKK
jgi:hypothetical protein